MLQELFIPLDLEKLKLQQEYLYSQFGERIHTYNTEQDFPSLEGIHIAIFGVLEDRGARRNTGCALAPNEVRKYLYALFEGDFSAKIADLGNILPGHTKNDTYTAVRLVCEGLIKQGILPVILGGGHDLSFGQYMAYKEVEQQVDLVVVDSRFDLDERDTGEISSDSYLNSMILQEPNNLLSYSNIGYQSHLLSQDSLRLMDKMYFDTYRLGLANESIQDMEPIIRHANMMSFDISAIRQSDAPGNKTSSPSGLSGEQVCRLCRYAGMNDKLLSIGFYEQNPLLDNNGQTSHLVAQMIWYFIEGYYHRQGDYPFSSPDEMMKYRVFFKKNGLEMVFYKSIKTDRWWMQVPYPMKGNKNERFCLVSCSYSDYQLASSGELPNRWWRAYQKLT